MSAIIASTVGKVFTLDISCIPFWSINHVSIHPTSSLAQNSNSAPCPQQTSTAQSTVEQGKLFNTPAALRRARVLLFCGNEAGRSQRNCALRSQDHGWHPWLRWPSRSLTKSDRLFGRRRIL